MALALVHLFASIDSFIIMLALGIGSALVEWWQRKRQSGQAEKPGAPPPPSETAPRPTAMPGDWEEELRRLLQGESPQPTAPPPPTPPPRAHQPEPAPAPPPLVARLEPARTARPPRESVDEAAPAPTADLAHLTESASAYRRASSLEELAQAQIHTATARTEHPVSFAPPSHRNEPVPEVAQVLQALQHPHTARQAMVGAIILGPPRGLEPLC